MQQVYFQRSMKIEVSEGFVATEQVFLEMFLVLDQFICSLCVCMRSRGQEGFLDELWLVSYSFSLTSFLVCQF